MDSNTKLLKVQIVRLLRNDCSQQEAKEFLQIPPDLLDAYLDEREWEEMEPGFVSPELSDLWLKQINRLKVPRVRTLFWKYISRAAVIVLLVAGVALYYTSSYNAGNPTARKDTVKRVPVFQERLISNRGRAKAKYKLPDLSTIELTPGSTLRYSYPLQADRRSLTLEGEAVFHVAKDAHRPFTVYTDGFATTALGTVFKITSFKGDKDARVRVISGKIVVQSSMDSAKVLYLKAGQQCRYQIKSQRLEMLRPRGKQPAKPSHQSFASAMHLPGAIEFKNTPLPEVLRQVGDIYKVNIKLSSETLGKRKFTGSFKKEEPMEKFLGTILLLNDLQYKKIADTIYVSPK